MWKKPVKKGCFEGKTPSEKQFSIAHFFQNRDIDTNQLTNCLLQTLYHKSYPHQVLQKICSFYESIYENDRWILRVLSLTLSYR